MGFFRQENWDVLPFPSPGDLPNLGIEPRSPTLQAILYEMSHQGTSKILEWFPSPADLPNPGIELGSPALQATSLPTELSGNHEH